jgi:hypothetical protein
MAPAPDLDTLIDRAQRACDALGTVRAEVALTRAETRRLIELSHQASALDAWSIPNAVAPIVEEPPADLDPHELAMEVLRLMRELLNGFPVEWQVNIVKALTARTMLIVATQLHTPPLTPSA